MTKATAPNGSALDRADGLGSVGQGLIPGEIVGPEGVQLVRHGDGSVFFREPRSVRDLAPDQRQHFVMLERTVRGVDLQLELLDQVVSHCRALRMSWATIGLATGLTAEGARKKWSE